VDLLADVPQGVLRSACRVEADMAVIPDQQPLVCVFCRDAVRDGEPVQPTLYVLCAACQFTLQKIVGVTLGAP
jgi:hypothetical protein